MILGKIPMLKTIAVANYRSLRRLVLPLDRLNVVTGANGSGKSSLYRSLRLLSETSRGTATQSIASEGGLESVLWAGPESHSRAVRAGEVPIQGGPRQEPVFMRLGFSTEEFGYAIDFGLPTPVPRTLFGKDPEIKREAIWHGDFWTERRATVDRRGGLVRARDAEGSWKTVDRSLPSFDSMLSRLADPGLVPEVLHLKEQIRSWRFYDHFRSDREAPARRPQIGTRTPVLSNDGHDLASAWQTIQEIGDEEALDFAVRDAFPGAKVEVTVSDGRFGLTFRQHGLLRGLSQAELSDGTLRYLLWIAALLTPRPPSLMVLNEPETSLHPDLLPALGRLMLRASENGQIWVVSHAPRLTAALTSTPQCHLIELDKELGETFVHGQDLFNQPTWKWPSR